MSFDPAKGVPRLQPDDIPVYPDGTKEWSFSDDVWEMVVDLLGLQDNRRWVPPELPPAGPGG